MTSNGPQAVKEIFQSHKILCGQASQLLTSANRGQRLSPGSKLATKTRKLLTLFRVIILILDELPFGTEIIISVPTTIQGTGAVRVIDFRHQFTAKLSAYYSRQSQNDYDDIIFLFGINSDAIFGFSYQLDLNHRQYFAEIYTYHNSSETSWIDFVRRVLRL